MRLPERETWLPGDSEDVASGPSRPSVADAEIYARFVRTALSLYGREPEFEIPVPDGYDEVEVAAAFRAAGCEITYLTPRRTVIVVPRRSTFEA